MLNDKSDFSRREFLKYSVVGTGATVAGLAGLELAGVARGRTIPGRIVGSGHKTGHLLREGGFPEPNRIERRDCVIVGGGMAGLSAAWRLQKKGFQDFVLLELEPEVGGNSAGGENRVSAYPWGAHYLPLPDERLALVRELLEEFGVIKKYDATGLPVYDEFHLCAAPQERLYAFGQWQDGLFPMVGATNEDIGQFNSFMAEMNRMRTSVGGDNKPAFAIPIDESSQDPTYLQFDRISMSQYMRERGWTSEPLLWHVDYCCRDDYGCNLAITSAWAGIHYFASRRGIGSNADVHTVLTWPEGNQWLVKRLRNLVAPRIQTDSLAYSVERKSDHVIVRCFDVKQRTSIEYKARNVIYAAPRFTAQYVLPEFRTDPPAYGADFSYAPWMVANITLEKPVHQHGVAPAWDNVIYQSESLGYVIANHQSVAVHPSRKNVWTYYWPLSSDPPNVARNSALSRSHGEWVAMILKDLRGAHPGIESLIENIDVWIWGHGMIRPTPGFIWGAARKQAKESLGGQIFFAHSDMSGISILEEAQFRGVQAADLVLRGLGRGVS